MVVEAVGLELARIREAVVTSLFLDPEVIQDSIIKLVQDRQTAAIADVLADQAWTRPKDANGNECQPLTELPEIASFERQPGESDAADPPVLTVFPLGRTRARAVIESRTTDIIEHRFILQVSAAGYDKRTLQSQIYAYERLLYKILIIDAKPTDYRAGLGKEKLSIKYVDFSEATYFIPRIDDNIPDIEAYLQASLIVRVFKP